MDRKLLERMQLGDGAALRRVYELYRDDLLTVAVCLVGDVAAAEDILHDVFVRLAASARTVGVRGNLKAYLAAWVANRARDQLRRRGRRDVSLAETAEMRPDSCPQPLETLLADERGRLMYRAISELPHEQREVITLHLHGEMTFREIAAHLDVRQNTVQSRYRYGLEKLRSILKTEDASCASRTK